MGYPQKGQADYLEVGTWNAECSMCGAKRKANTMVKNWMGQYRCPEHNEPRHPQDFVRAIPERITPPWVQHPDSNQPDSFVSFCDINGQSAFPNISIPDCMIPDNTRLI
jgi:hypothetical protein